MMLGLDLSAARRQPAKTDQLSAALQGIVLLLFFVVVTIGAVRRFHPK
jgi:hypothetical protein